MKVKASELREQTMEELNKRLSDTEEQLFKLRFQKSTGQIEDPTKIRDARRNIARVKTVINERRVALASAPVEEKSNE
jgi:large subunit ribosomal protein L29